ncbi:hypothetical protein AVEN_14407-1 [Araneus ventricosus]|uniref:Tc1-like transposase DDE domain-containing protein n=1 Tax=Araneus ventricosus TaxID=182803 RepID=A0A4Y2UKD9_ARAVE|nr:hypothetical protein AVEN_14407-1 [Araneus ventricosus]
MQDGARPHRTPAVFDFLSEHFNDRVIALDYDKHTGSGMAWPPFSPDLTPCDFFFGVRKNWYTAKLHKRLRNSNSTSVQHVRQFQVTCLYGCLDSFVSDCATLLLQMVVISRTLLLNFLQQSLQHFHTGFYFSYYAAPPVAENGN